MNAYRLARSARRDLDGIWEYIARDNERNANRLIDAVVGKFAKIADNPHLGTACEHYGAGFRYFPFRNYVIYYRLIDDMVEIMRVLHGAQDHDAEFGITPESDE